MVTGQQEERERESLGERRASSHGRTEPSPDGCDELCGSPVAAFAAGDHVPYPPFQLCVVLRVAPLEPWVLLVFLRLEVALLLQCILVGHAEGCGVLSNFDGDVSDVV